MPKTFHTAQMPRLAIAIMAAGKGTRLKSKLPKVLFEIGGKPLLKHVVAAALQVVPADDVYAIVGHEADRVREAIASTGINFIRQDEQRGTGQAVMVSQNALEAYDTVIVLSGDAPLISPATIKSMRDFHFEKKAGMTILSARLENPAGYGRIIRKAENRDEVQGVIEEKSATTEQKTIQEVNSGFYAFETKPLYQYIGQLKTDNPHGEYYLTDMASLLNNNKQRVVAMEAADSSEILGGNTRAELADIDRKMRLAKAQKLMSEGVTIFYPDTCVIDQDVKIGSDTTIEPFVQLLGNTQIGEGCRIRSYSIIEDSQLADGAVIRQGCILREAKIAREAVIGPYSHLRPGSEIGEGAHVGNFVETKKIRLGKGSKANHLTYLGDAEIGENVNIGAGTITCNYDGVKKNTTTIEDGVFVGSDSTLIAPLTIGKDSYVAAASCVTEDVPAASLAIARSRQITKEGWVKKNARIRKENS